MEQGVSPVIIDNTNTQAWEMKPYVEAALEMGYRVEFHEPDTWWKFDPEELEKRNKHGVTREKIAQMLERYEYQISIPIVMNSVVPPHKNPQRPPPQRRHRGTILKKNVGQLLAKAKQRKKRKRNKKMKGYHTEIRKEKLDGAAHHPSLEDRDTSASEEDESEENSKSLCAFSEGSEDPVRVREEQPNGDDGSRKEAAVVSRERFPVAVSEVSTMLKSALKNGLPVQSDSSLLIDLSPFSTENLTKNAFDDEETDQRHKDNLGRRSFLKISNDKNSIRETEGISEDDNTPLLSPENKLGSYQSTREADMEAKLLSLKGEEEETFRCYSSNGHDNRPDCAPLSSVLLKAEENSSNAWAFFSVHLPTKELQLGFDMQVPPSSWPEDKFVGEQRPLKMKKPKQTHVNSLTQLSCCPSDEGLLKENHQVTVTEEAGNTISNGLSASPAGEVDFDSLVEARATFTQCLSEVNVPGNDAAPITSKRKRYRRIVNLAPKFHLPRQIPGSTEGGKEVPRKEDVPPESVLEVEQKSFLSKDHGEECEQNRALQECSAPYSGAAAACSLPAPDADALLRDISYIHLGQGSPVPKYSSGVCVVSRTKEEQSRTLEQQHVVDKKEGESEQVSSEVINSQPDILSSVKVVPEYSEYSSVLASCTENLHEAGDCEPAEASQQPEDNQDVNVKCSFLGLPLSLGFAFQLVQLFGSPGLPLESLLPDDYIVPLDWKVSKMIYLLWKTSVEEKQNPNGLQDGNALADDLISLEDLNESGQENQGSSERLPETELFQEGIEENTVTHASTGCLDAVFHQS
ncbi:NEDD4-binding protein 2-like 2 isoform 3-T3 [Rhynochetos jubatus]